MTKAKLVILRHGETEYNKQRLLTGLHDAQLTEEGKQQALAAGLLISAIRFDKAYSSNLSRAFNTAAHALTSSKTQAHLLNPDGSWQIEQRPEIAEVDCGKFSGRSKDDPEVRSFSWGYDVALPGGESQKDVVERVKKFFDSEIMPRLQRGENVLIVAHSGILRAFDIVLGTADASLGIDQLPKPGEKSNKRSVPNAAPTVYEYENGALKSHFLLSISPANENNPPADKKKNQGPKL
jgi:2,3-bisphosphoglycerate-dependent phosphoglycerate mutase